MAVSFRFLSESEFRSGSCLKKKKPMYGKNAVVHESRYFIQARRTWCVVLPCWLGTRRCAVPTTPSRIIHYSKLRKHCKYASKFKLTQICTSNIMSRQTKKRLLEGYYPGRERYFPTWNGRETPTKQIQA